MVLSKKIRPSYPQQNTARGLKFRKPVRRMHAAARNIRNDIAGAAARDRAKREPRG
jgi:hypothetical protein